MEQVMTPQMSIEPNTETPSKPCRICQTVHPATREYFVAHKTGLTNTCKPCHSMCSNGRLVRINPFASKDGKRGCKTCLRRLPDTPEYFYVDSRNPNWTAYECRECSTKRHTQYNINNHEWFSQYQREWRQSNRQHTLEYFRAYRAANADKVKKWVQDWYNANSDRVRLHWLNREARKRSFPDTFTPQEFERMMDYWGGACIISGDTTNLHLDHWIPLADSNCPGTVAHNIVPMAAYLNFSKNDSDPLEWLILNFGSVIGNEIAQRVQSYFDWVRGQS